MSWRGVQCSANVTEVWYVCTAPAGLPGVLTWISACGLAFASLQLEMTSEKRNKHVLLFYSYFNSESAIPEVPRHIINVVLCFMVFTGCICSWADCVTKGQANR